ncbi:TPA: asparagine synthase C-terminal domain-containing protein, partial [Morganella morganii]|nr:asparagine synthase C-terminal domain-containing protein [Morganella morganii]
DITRNNISEHTWWSIENNTELNKTEDEWITEFNGILDDAVRIRLRSDVPFGAFLSGGVDSSTIVGYMSQHLQIPVKTFSIGFQDPKYDESIFAQEAADRFHTDHYSEKVEANLLSLWNKAIYHCDQPHGDVSFMPTLRVAELASKKVKMVLTGDGADELFAGYDKYKEFISSSSDTVSDDVFFSEYYSKI